MKKKGKALNIINIVCWLLVACQIAMSGIVLKREVADWIFWLFWSLGLVGYVGALFCSVISMIKHRKLRKTVAKLQADK